MNWRRKRRKSRGSRWGGKVKGIKGEIEGSEGEIKGRK